MLSTTKFARVHIVKLSKMLPHRAHAGQRGNRFSNVLAKRAAPLAFRPFSTANAGVQATVAYSQLPSDPSEMVAQAAAAIQRALQAGKKRQRIELLNPVNEKAVNFRSTETVDYPCRCAYRSLGCCAPHDHCIVIICRWRMAVARCTVAYE